jgi:glycerate-2-kinase
MPAPDRARTRALLEELYAAAVAAAAPGPALERALSTIDPVGPVRLFALGKASLPMAASAVAALTARGHSPAGGIVVPPADAPPPHPNVTVVPGDHPEPGERSRTAAAALAQAVADTVPSDEAWVLLSGGATSLLGAPIDGVQPADLTELYALLLGSGLDISAMNRIRKRFSRWGGGRLAAALPAAKILVFVVSDVIGDDLASIGSGPCEPDTATAGDVRQALESANLVSRIAPSLLQLLRDVEQGSAPETPKPDHPAFSRVETRLIVSNRLALEAAAARAADRGCTVQLVGSPLVGEASAAGREIARELLRYARGSTLQQPHCIIRGGETTVTLGADPPGLGGRSQELALAAAEVLGHEDGGRGVALLAAGTDGRDGPTDAAGAIVDGATWGDVRRRGRDPARDLAAHDAYRALDAAGALLRPGLTGTNVMDVVIGLC